MPGLRAHRDGQSRKKAVQEIRMVKPPADSREADAYCIGRAPSGSKIDGFAAEQAAAVDETKIGWRVRGACVSQ